MLRDVLEVQIGGEQYELMPDTQLSNQRINRTGLNAALAALVSNLRCGDMIVPVRSEEGKGGEVFDDLQSSPGTRETLEQFLKYQPRRENPIPSLKRTNERAHLWRVTRLVAPQEQRPDAGVDEQTHATRLRYERERSPL